MTNKKSGLWGNTDAYENYMGRWSQKVAPLFLHWLDAPAGSSWVDIGCGTGGLTELIARTCKPSSVFGIDTAEGFIEVARSRVKDAEFLVGSADDLEFTSDSIDYAVSGLVLNFVPDPYAAIKEMVRVVCPGGSVALYVWDYAGHMQIMRYFFDTAITFDARSAEFDDGIKAPICRPLALKEAFGSAGLTDVSVNALDITTPFENFDDYWAPFLGGVGSAPKYCVSLEDSVRDKIKEAIKEKLPAGPDGEILLAARAWAIRGTVKN
jgi:SAM-dependent methyltransferase